jgi:putative membrane protein
MLLQIVALSQFNRESFGQLLWAAIFGVLGIILIVAGYRIFDWVSPIDIEKELSEKQNVAVAIVCAAVILGIAWVIYGSIATPG